MVPNWLDFNKFELECRQVELSVPELERADEFKARLKLGHIG